MLFAYACCAVTSSVLTCLHIEVVCTWQSRASSGVKPVAPAQADQAAPYLRLQPSYLVLWSMFPPSRYPMHSPLSCATSRLRPISLKWQTLGQLQPDRPCIRMLAVVKAPMSSGSGTHAFTDASAPPLTTRAAHPQCVVMPCRSGCQTQHLWPSRCP